MRYKKEIKKYFLTPKYPDIYLSQREAECVAYFLEGRSNREVAKILKISSSTVNSYVTSIKLKLNCKSKRALVVKIFQTDLVNHLNDLLFKIDNIVP